MNYMARYETKWESERLVIQRKQHSKLCFSSQQGKPLTVENLKEDTIPFIDYLMKDVDPESV